jgi:tRNA U38,U39,U40 pseudouridine synthase TruA
MVRCLVSSMVAVGAGTLDEEEIDRRLESGDRHQLPQPAPAGGLALIGVGYDTLA